MVDYGEVGNKKWILLPRTSPWDKNTWERREMAGHDKLRRKVRLTVFPFSNILQVIYIKRCNFLGASNRGSARLLLDLAIHRYMQ